MKTKFTIPFVLVAGALIGYVAANADFGATGTAEARHDDAVTIPTVTNSKIAQKNIERQPAISTSGTQTPDGHLQGKVMLARSQQEVAALSATSLQRTGKKPNILVIWGDDIGVSNISAYHRGMMEGRTPNIDRIAN